MALPSHVKRNRTGGRVGAYAESRAGAPEVEIEKRRVGDLELGEQSPEMLHMPSA
jgi:hypothetical protein